MAQYFTGDFADFATDWTARYNAPATGAFAVAGGNLQLPSGKSADWCLASWNDIDLDAGADAVEVLALFTCSDTPTAVTFPVMLRAGGSDEAVAGWSVSLQASVGRLRVVGANGADAPINISALFDYGAIAAGVDFWLRLRLELAAGVTTYRAKVWLASAASEPSWQITGTDSTYPQTAGWVGVSTYGLSGANTHICKQFGVGTAGDAAPAAALGSSASATLALSDGVDVAAVVATAPVNASVATLDSADAVVVVAEAPAVPGSVRLSIGIERERGSNYASVSGLRWVVFNAAQTAVVAAGSGLATNAAGVAIIDLSESPYAIGDYAPVMITEYNAALPPQDREVRTMFGFVPATAQS